MRTSCFGKIKSTPLVFIRQQPKLRKESLYGNHATQPEYQYINYDLALVKKEFERVSEEVMNLQMALDKYNQTFEFEVEL